MENIIDKDSAIKHVIRYLTEQKAPKSIVDYFDELCKHVDLAYLQLAEQQVELSQTTNADFKVFNTFVKFWDISQLCHFKDMHVALFMFDAKGNDLSEYMINKKTDPGVYTGSFNIVNRQIYVLAYRNSLDVWCIYHHGFDMNPENAIDVSKATRFTTFASEASRITKTGIVASNKRLRHTIQNLQESLEYKTHLLDALGYIYCSGSCGGGQFRFTPPKQLDVKTYIILYNYVCRLGERLTSHPEPGAWTQAKMQTYVSWLANKNGLVDFVASAHAGVDRFEEHAHRLSEHATIEQITSYLLARNVLVLLSDEAGVFSLCVDSSTWFYAPHTRVTVSGITEIREVYEAYLQTPNKKFKSVGLINWCCKKLNARPKPEYVSYFDLPFVTYPDNFYM